MLTAANLPDLLFAQGYITAGDRLWQMDALRRHAAGELAAILGPAMVEHDRRQRYLQIRAAADRAVTQLPPDQLAQLQAYAGGVNAYIEAHQGTLPLEFKLLAYRPALWTPRDSLLVSLAMWQDLSTEFPRKMDPRCPECAPAGGVAGRPVPRGLLARPAAGGAGSRHHRAAQCGADSAGSVGSPGARRRRRRRCDPPRGAWWP